MERLPHLIAALGENEGPRMLVVIEIRPRASHVGELEAIGYAVESVRCTLAVGNSRFFRIMWGLGVGLLEEQLAADEHVEDACRKATNPDLEIFAMLVALEGRRSSAWLDDVLSETGARHNLGAFRSEPAKRLLDGRWLTEKELAARAPWLNRSQPH